MNQESGNKKGGMIGCVMALLVVMQIIAACVDLSSFQTRPFDLTTSVAGIRG